MFMRESYMYIQYIYTHTHTSMSGSYFRLLDSDRIVCRIRFAVKTFHSSENVRLRGEKIIPAFLFSRFYIRYSNKKYKNNTLAIHKFFMPVAFVYILQ